ncbi:MAG: response regulator transcription factor [Gammaproteobacteria bacterium]|nr:response regulator transcription factor [Gammaproteobacteria bacterium]
MMQSIVCVEDDPDIGRLLVGLLGDAGYPVQWVTSGKQALEHWRGASLVLLDLMLPDLDGLEVCREIRARDSSLPLIMLTAKAGARDVIHGLEIGADDYITKPFDGEILLARVAALLRRHEMQQQTDDSASDAPLRCGDLVLDIEAHRASLLGKPLMLTAKEFALLGFFVRHPGRTFTRGDLLDAVWGMEFDGFDHTVNTHINRLRSKIEDDPSNPRYIHTVWGVGYRFGTPDAQAES